MRQLLAAFVLIATIIVSTSAFGHASLLGTEPADGSIVASPPQTLTLVFNEQVSPITLTLITPDGRSLTVGTYKLEDTKVAMQAPNGLGNGTYALSWRVISADGHPIGGTTLFSVGAPSSGSPSGTTQAIDWPVRIAIWISRVLTYVGLFVGVGGVFFCRWIGRSTVGLRAVRPAIWTGLVALPIGIGLQGLDALDLPLGNIVHPLAWIDGAASSFGWFTASAAIGLLLALVASFRVRLASALALLGFLAVGPALALTGHASAADPQWLTRPVVFIHTSVVAYWVGSLLPLAALLREPGNMAAPALRRFSNTIGPLLLLLVLTGTTIAVVQIRGTQELLDTDYGHVFLAKMVLVAVLLGLGAFNRWGLTGSVLEDAELAKRTLVRSIAFELVLVTLVLAVVALWRFTPPPRALLDAAAQPVLVQLQSSDAMATLTLTPDHPGPVDLSVSLMGPDMARLAAQGLTVDLSNKEKGIEPIERQATLGPDGNWHVAALTLPAAGQWEIELDILISDFKEITLTGSAQVRP